MPYGVTRPQCVNNSLFPSISLFPSTHWGLNKMAYIFANDIFQCISLNENFLISNEIRLFVHKITKAHSKETTKAPHYWPFARGTPQVIGGFPSQRPVIWRHHGFTKLVSFFQFVPKPRQRQEKSLQKIRRRKQRLQEPTLTTTRYNSRIYWLPL